MESERQQSDRAPAPEHCSPDTVAIEETIQWALLNRGRELPKVIIGRLTDAVLLLDSVHDPQARDRLAAWVYENLGNSYIDAGDPALAVLWLSQLLVLPSLTKQQAGEGLLNKGLMQFKRQFLRNAAADFRQAMNFQPNDPRPHYWLGRSYGALGKFKDALAAFSRAIELDPSSANAYQGRAECHEQLGQSDEAAADRAKAQELCEQQSQ